MGIIESKAFIFAQGGMSIGIAISLLDASDGKKIIAADATYVNDIKGKLFTYSKKRISGLLVAVFGFITLSPILIIVSIVIFASSVCAVLFNREPIGLRGYRFLMFKIRSIFQNTEKTREKSGYSNKSNDPSYKIINDTGIIKTDRILPGTTTGELISLSNVTTRDIAICELYKSLPVKLQQHECLHFIKLLVIPKPIGTWQILPDGNEVNLENWKKMEIHYIDNRSIKHDLALFLKNFQTVACVNTFFD